MRKFIKSVSINNKYDYILKSYIDDNKYSSICYGNEMVNKSHEIPI